MMSFTWKTLLAAILAPRVTALSCKDSYCRALTTYPNFAGTYDYTCWIGLPEMDDDVFEKSEDEKVEELQQIMADPTSGYCANGHVGRIMESIPPAIVEDEKKWYYTCCHPDSIYADFDQDPVPEPPQTCSSVDVCSSTDWAGGSNCWADGFLEPMSCNDEEYRYPHYIGNKVIYYVKYACCNAPQEDEPFMDNLRVAQIIWLSLSAVSFLVCSTFIAAILSNRKARSSGYNIYLVFLGIPDASASFVLVLRNALAMRAWPTGPTPYLFMSSYEYFYAASNMWLNAVIVVQIHWILRKASQHQQVSPPSVGLVCLQASLVYVFAGGVFAWASFLYLRGLVRFTWEQALNLWTSTRATLVGIPLIVLLVICFDVWNRGLLPVRGKTRLMALYFLRVVIVFMVTWLPYFLMYEISFNITENVETVRAAHYFNAVQGTISVIVSLSKPDVRNAFLEFCAAIPGFKQCIGACVKKPSHDREQETSKIGTSSLGNVSQVNPRSNDDLWEEEDVWEDKDMDDNLREVLSAWKTYRKKKAGGILDQKVATAPKAACGEGQVYRLKPAPEEQDPRNLEGEDSCSGQEDPLQAIWASEDIEDVVVDHKESATPSQGIDSEEWFKRYQERLQSRMSTASADDTP